jgi:hypothetical protein
MPSIQTRAPLLPSSVRLTWTVRVAVCADRVAGKAIKSQRQIMTRNKILCIAALLVVMPTLARLGYRELQKVALTTKAASFAPFTLRLRESIKQGSLTSDPDKPLKVARDITIAVRADGSRVEHDVVWPGQPNERWTRTVRFADYRIVKVWGPGGLKATGVPSTPDTARNLALSSPTAGSNCLENGLGAKTFVGYEYAGKEWIGDILTVKLVRHEPHNVTGWHAPEFGCVQLRRTIEFKGCCTVDQVNPKGPTSDSSDLAFVNLTRSEPDPALFDVSKFKESPPSVAVAAHLRAGGFPEDYVQKVLKEQESADKAYWSLREKAGIRPD